MAKIEIKTVQTDGFSMRYFQFGTGNRPMVILPGLSVQSVMNAADAVADAYRPLAGEFTIYVFDRREELPPVYSVHDMARDTAMVLTSLELRGVSLFGASQGGMIALLVALEYPERVNRLALGSSAARVGKTAYRVIENWVALAKRNDALGLYQDFGKKVYPPAVFRLFQPALTAAAQTVTEEELARFVILAEGTRDFDVTDRLNGLGCPVLVLGAADDAVLGADAAGELIEGRTEEPLFEYHLYDGYGHAAFDTAPDYKNRLLRFFLQS